MSQVQLRCKGPYSTYPKTCNIVTFNQREQLELNANLFLFVTILFSLDRMPVVTSVTRAVIS